MLRLFLQQTNQPGRINVFFSANSITPPFSLPSSFLIPVSALAGADGQHPAGYAPDPEQAEAIDKLDFDLFQFVFRFALAIRL